MLTTFNIGPHTGRVCYSTVSPSGTKHITVECPEEKLALRFESNDFLKIGDWVRVHGSARIDSSVRSDESPAEPSGYYHEPHDKSGKKGWIFKQMTSGTCTRIGPPIFTEKLHEAMLCLRRHLDSWEKNLEVPKWEETAASIRDVLELVEKEISDRKPIPTVSVNINDADL